MLEQAAVDIPALCVTGDAAVQHLSVLFGFKESQPEDTLGQIRQPDKDMQIEFPIELIINRVPFARYYPKAEALVAHIAAMHRFIGMD